MSIYALQRTSKNTRGHIPYTWFRVFMFRRLETFLESCDGVCPEGNQCWEISVFVTLKNNITQILYSSSAFVHRKVLAIKTLDFHLQPIVDQCQ
jgi:hypothetical protein